MDLSDIIADVAKAEPIVAERSVPVVPGRCVHIDGDMLAYWAGGNEETSIAKSREILLNKIAMFKEMAGAERVQLHLTADGSTKGDRYAVATVKPYQGQRKGHKPKNWGYLRQYMSSPNPLFTTKTWFDREADDGFGYISTALPNDVVATRDKDMRMLPMFHITWDEYLLVDTRHDPWELVADNGLLYGFKWFCTQMLWGDSADNIPGLPKHPQFSRGVGEKSAAALLAFADNKVTGWQDVCRAYQQNWDDVWADMALEQAVLLWIRRGKRGDLLEVLEYLPTTELTPQLQEAGVRLRKRVEDMKREAASIQG